MHSTQFVTSAHFDVSFEIILHRKKMLKALVCVSCIFFFYCIVVKSQLSIVILRRQVAALVSGFTGQTCSEATLRRDKRDKETRASRLWRPTEAAATPPHRDKSGPPGLSAWQTWGPIELIGSEQRGANSRDASTQHPLPWFIVHSDCHWLFSALPVVAGHERTIVITDYILEVVLPFSITGAGLSPKVCRWKGTQTRRNRVARVFPEAFTLFSMLQPQKPRSWECKGQLAQSCRDALSEDASELRRKLLSCSGRVTELGHRCPIVAAAWGKWQTQTLRYYGKGAWGT